VRTRGPCLPSGRRLASTGHRVPSLVTAEQARINPDASWWAVASAADSLPSAPATGSATKITSTSLT